MAALDRMTRRGLGSVRSVDARAASGWHLYEQIRVLEWQQPAFLILMIMVTVAIIDAISQRLRTALTGRRA